MARPSIKLDAVADSYAQRDLERIAEIGSGTPGGPGGLLSLRRTDDGGLTVSVYRTDENVRVVTGKDTMTFVDGVNANVLVAWWMNASAEERAATGIEMFGPLNGTK